jgi:hypothetical protein
VRGPIAAATRIIFRAAASVRGARVFHPKGVAYRATAVIDDTAPTGMPRGSFEGIVRFSRGAGLPDVLPDVHGVAVKLLDACGDGCDQDLLLASSWSPRLTRRLLRPTRSFGTGLYSSVLPYDAAGASHLVAARFRGSPPADLDELVAALDVRGCRLELLVAPPTGPWRVVGRVEVHPVRLADDAQAAVSFDPWHTAGGFVPTGTLNRLRRPAYNASRQGRPHGRDHEPEPGRASPRA